MNVEAVIELEFLAKEAHRLSTAGIRQRRVCIQCPETTCCTVVLDLFADEIACATVISSTTALWSAPHGYSLTLAPNEGLTLLDSAREAPRYWFALFPRQVHIDGNGRLLELVSTEQFNVLVDHDISGRFEPDEHAIESVIWILPPHVQPKARVNLERGPWYMLGSHTKIQSRTDIYLHIVAGVVFENRFAWPNRWRVFSENDAHALHLIVGGWARATSDPLLRSMRDQLLLCVLDRQAADGGFHHGEWTDQMESHYRLHCSAMHLMMDAISEGIDGSVHSALASAAAFLARQSVDLHIGKWLLHDELEHSVAQMKLGPFRWVRSDAFGKAESNMLVLNSHLDGLIALDRYRALTGDAQFDGLVQSACQTTRALLSARSAEPLYRVLMWMIEMTFLPAPKAAALPVWKRALKRVAWKYLIPRLPDLKARFPRLVMPGGYIDRELTLRTWAHDYHAINLMDLARYLRRFDCPVVRQVLIEGLAFTRRSGILESWREMRYQKYALGFWAEALYHVCTIFPDAQYRQWLAEAMLVLEEMQMGQPPSLLGANAEAVPVPEQMPCPSPQDARLRIANLGRRGAPELLIVNPTDAALPLHWELAPCEPVAYAGGDARPVAGPSPAVPARGWLWARGPQ